MKNSKLTKEHFKSKEELETILYRASVLLDNLNETDLKTENTDIYNAVNTLLQYITIEYRLCT
ncbi:MAG: hypothetical protein GY760_17975 [Deltaproteobacteria bacterium]|nr:hypothetical protein [Deltaproteobacteria bacterium]